MYTIETVYADDTDAYVDRQITDAAGVNLTFDAKVASGNGPYSITGTWQGTPAPTRTLRIPVTSLGVGGHHLYLRVVGGNDIDLGWVKIIERTPGVTTPIAPVTADSIVAGLVNDSLSGTRVALSGAYAQTVHTHGLSGLTATGTKDATTFLRGDNTWATPAGAAGGGPLTGTGFPEGLVTATVGTEYVDTAVTSGAVKWIKATGSGNTGWRIAFGDTGWRNLALPTGLTAGTVSLRRINDVVYLSWTDITAAAGFGNAPALIPAGFGAGKDSAGVIVRDGAIAGGVKVVLSPTNRMDWNVTNANNFHTASIDWPASDPWPSVLP